MAASGLTFEEFASAHLDALSRFATALTNDRELGADLVQDALLRAHERWAHVGSRMDPVPMPEGSAHTAGGQRPVGDVGADCARIVHRGSYRLVARDQTVVDVEGSKAHPI